MKCIVYMIAPHGEIYLSMTGSVENWTIDSAKADHIDPHTALALVLAFQLKDPGNYYSMRQA